MAPQHVNIQNKARADSKVFTVERLAAEHSTIIRNLIADFADDENTDLTEAVIPISMTEVSDDAIAKVLEWATEYKDLAKPSEDEKEVQDRAMITFTDWEKKMFDDMTSQMLYEVLVLTNFLEFNRLYNLACLIVANMLKNKTASQIREILAIESDFTPEEEEEIRKETAWAFERNEADTAL
ncbi:Skp1 family, dimerization domain-containing protein [Chaetomium sp. MPI-CAGE-AT-0009]|nr:Skp1 family, dimerization domain-containing protein [Chaetomium sp. MPI-CAGE-AT-0009]